MSIDYNFEGNPDILFNEKFSSVVLLRKRTGIVVVGNPKTVKENGSRFTKFGEGDRIDISIST
jgi:hypothetical protein